MYNGDELLVHTGELSMQSALGFYSNGSFGSEKDRCKDDFNEYIKKTETGKLLIRAGMLGTANVCGDAQNGFPPHKQEDEG